MLRLQARPSKISVIGDSPQQHPAWAVLPDRSQNDQRSNARHAAVYCTINGLSSVMRKLMPVCLASSSLA